MRGQAMKLILGDCLEKMKDMPNGSVDCVITDPPYGTTACKWDTCIPFEPMWEQLNRIIKPNGAIVLFGSEPFSSALRMSNIKNYKYDIIFEKDSVRNPYLCKKQIMQRHENISIFYKKQCHFSPQMEKRKEKNKRNNNINNKYRSDVFGDKEQKRTNVGNNDFIYPSSIQKFTRGARGLHPTQKPVALVEYLIKTYTNEGETVLDFTMGSGTTGVACKNLNRNFIGIELDAKYFEIAKQRIEGAEHNQPFQRTLPLN
jgi:site-specific DNA-methyltransferase (adenine-specific)